MNNILAELERILHANLWAIQMLARPLDPNIRYGICCEAVAANKRAVRLIEGLYYETKPQFERESIEECFRIWNKEGEDKNGN